MTGAACGAESAAHYPVSVANLNQPASSESCRAAGCASPGKLAVLFDGACSTCREAAEAMRRFDNSGALELLDLHDPNTQSRFPSLELDHLLEELHVVDDAGRIYRGARAINRILRFQHGLKGYLAYLWYLPGFAWLADRQYKRFDKSRYKCSVGSTSSAGASSEQTGR